MASMLKSIKPTDEEMKAARAILNAGGKKEDKAKQARKTGVNLKYFAEKQTDATEEDKKLVRESRGSEREQLNLLYLVHTPPPPQWSKGAIRAPHIVFLGFTFLFSRQK